MKVAPLLSFGGADTEGCKTFDLAKMLCSLWDVASKNLVKVVGGIHGAAADSGALPLRPRNKH